MSYNHNKQTSFDITFTSFHPNPSSSNLTVEFTFLIKSDKVIMVEGRRNSAVPLLRHFPPRPPRTAVPPPPRRWRTASRSRRWNGMVEAVEEAVGDRPDEDDVVGVVHEAWERLSRRFLTGNGALTEHGVFRLFCEVRIEEWHVYTVEGGGGGDRAAESSVGMLEKYEVRGGEEDVGCCICLEELGGGGGGRGGAVRMPCLHVFHGGCIGEWLRKSRRCPLCRYEMPTE